MKSDRHDAESVEEKLQLAKDSWVNLWSTDELRQFAEYTYDQGLIVLRVEVYRPDRIDGRSSYIPMAEHTFYMDAAPADHVNRLPENRFAIDRMLTRLATEQPDLHHQVWVCEPF